MAHTDSLRIIDMNTASRLLRTTRIIVILMTSMVLFGLPIVVKAVRFTGRITNTDYALCYSITVDPRRNLSGDTDITVTMITLSGDLAPFLVLRDGANENVLVRSHEMPDNRSELTYVAEAFGEIEIVATRNDGVDGTTTGEFLLLIEGSDTVDETPSPMEPCHQPQSHIFSNNENMELPRLKNREPAILLPIDRSVNGVINDQVFIVYYLLDISQARSYKIEMSRAKDGGEDLLPFMGIIRLDEEEILIRSINQTDTTAMIEFNPQVISKSTSDRWFVLAVSRVDVENGITTGKYQLRVTTNRQ